ncbi:hypothetical protein [Coprococcus sp. RTP21281st1_F1_RTP21281_210402]|uniref:hypothetical protein n=1 Tax=Coprococcus sp. RTP21281st1_F1_RTP21281_210402 TaxID=3143208 RepID=UPI0034A5197E
MNIQTISKEKREVMVELTADDLVIICNALYVQSGEKKNNDYFMQLYSDMMMARDLCQYGHVDNFCLHNVVRCRSGLKGLLSEADVETFNAYLEDNDLPTAFGNSDFVRIYKRIVGDLKDSDKLKSWMEQNK